MAAGGLYLHPDLKQVEVAGVPVKGMVDAVRDFISKRGFVLGRTRGRSSSSKGRRLT
jgi:hypothetical protein